jgi:two-component sensor histidine kinase
MTEVAAERMLLHELNHRTNNEFAAAISAVSLAARRSNNDEVKAALSEVVELLHQYADVHHALQMPVCLVLAAQPLPLPADHC